jgi:hypothetical protein
MADTTLDQEEILRVVRSWPRSRQEQLAHRILSAVKQEQEHTIDPTTGRPYVSAEELRGILAVPGKPAPTDEDIERIRMEAAGG